MPGNFVLLDVAHFVIRLCLFRVETLAQYVKLFYMYF